MHADLRLPIAQCSETRKRVANTPKRAALLAESVARYEVEA